MTKTSAKVAGDILLRNKKSSQRALWRKEKFNARRFFINGIFEPSAIYWVRGAGVSIGIVFFFFPRRSFFSPRTRIFSINRSFCY